ncbi:hypothetical protein EGY05_08395 [Chryseobacterium arthrosphaerae]|uniref:Uncharacterized protein n=1 Tax=Chryseobacterium arthrosphaerae TaxID=651561 RepID=A0A1B8ZQ51_9FLAO|nr:hypothetical protein [Chryseobacterium arthrosphaerae]AYZ11944.1 hypothetical protein EGY05_08395 [Chryseobacterium arthrosphaerae]OCA73732.1 hypothetical protein BBI00_04955 [Chryseobacterium arthrosphaerae]
MKVVFVSDDFKEIDINIPAVEFETVPVVGDWVNIESYIDEMQWQEIEKYLYSVNKLAFGLINGRTWTREANENILYVHLTFSSLDE